LFFYLVIGLAVLSPILHKIFTTPTLFSKNTIPPVQNSKILPVNNALINRHCFIDVETANEDPTSICSIAIAHCENGQISAKQWLVKPPSNRFSFTHIHGITYDMVKNSPTFDVIWTTYVLPYISNKVLVAHYAHFDINAIFKTLDFYKITPDPLMSVNDTCILARTILPNLPNHKLPTLANHFNLKLNHHNALSDVMVCANIFNLFVQTNSQEVIASLMPANLVADKKSYNMFFFDN